MAEEAQRLASLVVVGGPLKDRRYDLDEVVAEVLIGSDSDCHLHVDLPGISPIHARLWTDLNSVTVYDTHAPRGVYVNDDQVTGEAPINGGDWLWLGPPAEPDSVCIQCRFEAWEEVLPEAEQAAEGAPPASPPLESGASPPPPLEAYEPGLLVDETAPEPSAEPPAVTTPSSAEEPAGPSVEPGLEALLPPTPETVPPVAESRPASSPPAPEEDALFAEADLAPPEAPAPVPEPAAPTRAPAAPDQEPTALAPAPAAPAPAPRAPVPEPAAPVPEPRAPAPEPAAPAPEPAAPVPEPAAPALAPAAPAPEPAAPAPAPAPAREPAAPAREPEPAPPPAATPVEPAPPPEAPPEPDPAAPPQPAEAPFFLGEEGPATTEEAAPAAPDTPPDLLGDDAWSIAEPPPSEAAPTAAPEAPVEDHFFIAEEVLTEPAPASPPAAGAAPAEDAAFVEAEPALFPPAGPTPTAEPGGATGPGPAVPVAGSQTPGTPVPEMLDSVPLLPPEPGVPAPTPEAPLVAQELPAVSGPSPEGTAAPAPVSPGVAAPSTAAPPSDAVLQATEVPTPEAPAAPAGPPPAAPSERPAPARARPRPPAAARRAPAAGARRPARPRGGRGGAPEWLRPVGIGAGAALILGIIGIGLVIWFGGSVSVDEVSPARLRVGQRAVLTGSGFSNDPGRNTVLFGGVTATVISASKTQLEVEVPEAVAEAGSERRVPVVVRKGNLESEPLEVSVFQGPVLHGLSPDAALPGEEVTLAGAGWGIGATVRFGDVAGEILEIDTTQIRVTVPPVPGEYGTAAPVVVTVGGVESNAAPFFVGRLPLVTGLQPAAVSMGDVLTISGRGFGRDPGQNDVRVAGAQALVVSASNDELTIVVPRLEAGDPARSLEIRVPGSQDIGRGIVEVAASGDPIGLRFIAEPFDGPSAHPHAVLSTGLGPAFVLAAADGRSAAERALAAQQAFNTAVPTLTATPGFLPEARDLQTKPVLGLPGQFEALLEVTEADAAAYNEDWTRLRGRARAVTPARLARWWEAVARDLVLMLVRAEPPRFAAALAPEGRAFQQVFDAALRAGGPGVSPEVVAGLRRGTLDGLRVVALRVPTSVSAEAPAAAAAAAAAPTPATAPQAAPLRLEGSWTGTESEQGRQRYVTVTFRRDYGSIAYEGGLTLTVPFLKLERPGRNRVRFTVQMRGGIRHYLGRWDGETLSGDIARDEAGRDVVGTFELRPR